MKKMLILSHVLPFPGFSGQQQRVKYTLKALQDRFRVTFLTFADESKIPKIEAEISDHCEKVICLPSKYNKSNFNKAYYKSLGKVKTFANSLNFSNYRIGDLEFAEDRIAPILAENHFDCALFEYWHAFKRVDLFRKNEIPCVLDMHNVLWQSQLNKQNGKFHLSKRWKENRLNKYISVEENSWNKFDGIIAINKKEFQYVKKKVKDGIKVFHTPMGIDLNYWKAGGNSDKGKPKIAYYGGLGSSHNQQSALECYREIMPEVWRKFPDAEFWIVGSKPPEHIKELPREDSRVFVTGFVEDVKEVLEKMSVVVCPWQGTYGFRSRLIEVMALGIPLVTTPDAVYGMELQNEKGVLLGESNEKLSEHALKILSDKKYAERQSRLAGNEVEKLFSLENTYDKLVDDLNDWLNVREKKGVSAKYFSNAY